MRKLNILSVAVFLYPCGVYRMRFPKRAVEVYRHLR